MIRYFGILFLLLAVACHVEKKSTQTSTKHEIENSKEKPQMLLGVEVLQQINFDILQGKRVGLITNPSGVNRQLKSTIDIFYESEHVNLVALFSPEHGVRGNYSAGDYVGPKLDEKTGVPVFSLYGKNKYPDKAAMDMLDVLVYDIQDIGVRSYTYISTLGMIMEVAAEYNKEVIILDRPNPLGGERVEGAEVESGFYSFVGQYSIPYIYGLTCGELARLINYEGMLGSGKICNLQVVPMQGWTRNMIFCETDLIWVPTSPHIPDWQYAFYYAATGILGELDANFIGIGYTLPFKTLVTPNINAEQLCTALNQRNLKGVHFRPIYYKPYYKDKVGVELQGAQIHITDFKQVNLTQIQFYFIQEATKLDPNFKVFDVDASKQQMFDLVCGTDKVRKALMQNADFSLIKPFWNKDTDEFKQLSQKYYLYE